MYTRYIKAKISSITKQHGSSALNVSTAKPKIVASLIHVHVFQHSMDDFFINDFFMDDFFIASGPNGVCDGQVPLYMYMYM